MMKKKWKLYLGILLIFVFGFIIGSVSTGLFIHHKVRGFIEAGPEGRKKLVLKKLTWHLSLREEQKPKIMKVLDQTFLELAKFRKAYLPTLKKIITQSKKDIEQHLDEKQKKRLEKMFQRFQKDVNLNK